MKKVRLIADARREFYEEITYYESNGWAWGSGSEERQRQPSSLHLYLHRLLLLQPHPRVVQVARGSLFVRHARARSVMPLM